MKHPNGPVEAPFTMLELARTVSDALNLLRMHPLLLDAELRRLRHRQVEPQEPSSATPEVE